MVLTWDEFVSGKMLTDIPVSLTIGVFDGVHAGHRKLIAAVMNNSSSGISAVLTFNTNPRIVLGDSTYPGNISSLDQKIDILHSLGIDRVIVIDFSTDFSRLSGELFLKLLLESCRLEFLALGENFRFGYRGETSAQNAENILRKSGIKVDICRMADYKGEIVSSTRIRKAINNGYITEANIMLNRVFSLDTANIPQIPSEKTITIENKQILQVLPPQGLYEVEVFDGGVTGTKTSCLIEQEFLKVNLPGKKNITEIRFISDKQ